jgi:hypothetical protein
MRESSVKGKAHRSHAGGLAWWPESFAARVPECSACEERTKKTHSPHRQPVRRARPPSPLRFRHLPCSPGVHQNSSPANPNFSSVTSVTSVRCFPPRFVPFSSSSAGVHQHSFPHKSPSSSVTSVRCFPPIRAVLAQQRRCPSTFVPPYKSPSFSVTSVTSMRCFPPIRAVLAQWPRRPPEILHFAG